MKHILEGTNWWSLCSFKHLTWEFRLDKEKAKEVTSSGPLDWGKVSAKEKKKDQRPGRRKQGHCLKFTSGNLKNESQHDIEQQQGIVFEG